MSNAKAVPKFGTFRPKLTSDNQVNNIKDRPASTTKSRNPIKDRHRQDPQRFDSSEKLRSYNTVKSDIRQDSDHDPISLDFRKESELYIIDQRGDPKNLVYGSIHRWSVPSFKRYGAGSILGLSPTIKIERKPSDKAGIVLSSTRNLKFRPREKYVFSELERDRPRLLKLRSDPGLPDSLSTEEDFIALTRSATKQRCKPKLGETDINDFRGDLDYRSVHGKAGIRSEPAEEHFEYVEESDSFESDAGRSITHESSFKERNIELSRRVEQCPNIESWIALIEHQDNLLQAHKGRGRITKAEISSTTEIKIHMFEQALQSVHKLEERERLILGFMSEGAKVWELQELSDRWRRISEDNIESLVLWKSYLNFRQTNFSEFHYEEVKNIYLLRLEALQEALSSASPTDCVLLYLQIIYVLLRLTIYARESGFSEFAIAAWQALLEINFFRPEQLDVNELGPRFQEYWDSEVPRIGEIGSLGWRAFVTSQSLSTSPEANVEEAPIHLTGGSIFKNYSVAEIAMQKTSRLPARTMDDIVEDDPYRMILFSDFEPFVILVSSDLKVQRALLDAYLIFCGLPPVQRLDTDDVAHTWDKEGFLNRESIDGNVGCTKKCFKSTSQAPSSEMKISDATSIVSTPVADFVDSSETYFCDQWFKTLKSWEEAYPRDSGAILYDWLRNGLQQLVEAICDEAFAVYYLAFAWRNEPKSIKKTAKNLLKRYSTSQQLYNAYAMIESTKGNRDVANGVFSAALHLGTSGSQNENNHTQSQDAILLWKSWTWACLDDGDHENAVQHLLSVPDGSPSTKQELNLTSILKTKQHFSSRTEYFSSSGQYYHALLHTECLALFEYLTSIPASESQSKGQGNIAAAITVINSFSTNPAAQKMIHHPLHALLLQSSIRLLYLHIRSGPYRPAFIRSHLSRCLALFPDNTIFLSFFSWIESRVVFASGVRTHLSAHDTITTHLFAIHGAIQDGNDHSIRAAFEHAVSSTACQGAVRIWRLYILWCAQTDFYRKKAKEVWLRGLRACPWCKDLFLTGFGELGADLGIEEGRGIWRVMGEKELRIHVDLEEYFDDPNER